MDFFGAQDQARRKTWQLAGLFGAAVLSLIFLTNLLVALVYAWTTSYARAQPMSITGLLSNLPAEYWGWISFGVIGAVVIASLYKYFLLRGGGRAIAESLGGTPLTSDIADAAQRRLLNVVEEMAIASGVPVPPVYLIGEPSINAFAAGFSPDDAVIGVNQGTIDHLSRDELQGVIGHEFSHILNGDMRLNLRLMAALFGILFIGLVGRGLLHGVGHSSRRSSSRGSSSGGAPVLALGVGFLVIGYAGTFFGNLIKAAVSRQREFLADASSVQFTRNPGGLAGALKKIGGLSVGSTIRTAAAGEASHMFFGQIGPMFLNRYMATHPPLEERILVIEPRWDGRYPALTIPSSPDQKPDQLATVPASAEHPGAASFAETADVSQATAPAGNALLVMADPNEVTEAVGQLTEHSLSQALQMIHVLPADLREAAHDPFASRAIFYALVLNEEADIRTRQLELIDANAEAGVPLEVLRLYPRLRQLTEPPTLVLLELAMPALKELSRPQYQRFMGNLRALIKLDSHIDLMEWVLHRVLTKELRPHFEGTTPVRGRYNRVEDLAESAKVLLAALARHAEQPEALAAAGQVPASVSDAFAAGIARLALEQEPQQGRSEAQQPPAFQAAKPDNPYLLADDPNFTSLNAALGKLRALKPLQKPRLIKACAATVLADGAASGRQGALLQGIAATLDCPLPPSIYGKVEKDG